METSSSSDGGGRITGFIGILLGVFMLVAVAAFLYIVVSTPKPTPSDLLSQFTSNQNSYYFLAAGISLFAAFAVAFAGGFSSAVREKSPTVSTAAAFLVAAGALTLAISWDVLIGSLYAITQAPATGAFASDGAYFAGVMDNFNGFLNLLTFLLIGIGSLLFSWTIWKGEKFPRWISYVLLLAGVLGFLSALPPTNGLGIVSVILLGVWGIGAGRVLLRTKPTMAEPAK